MKVKELIKELESKNPEAEVLTEGCDCIGRVDRIEDDAVAISDTVIIMRPEHRI